MSAQRHCRPGFAVYRILPLWITLAVLQLGSVERALAQQQRIDLRGVVVDAATELPVPGAAVRLVDHGSTVYADGQGRFRILRTPTGPHTIEASMLGYHDLSETRTLTLDEPELRIALQPNPVALEAIGVVSDRLERRRNAVATSVRTYDADALRFTGGWDLLDVLSGRLQTVTCPRLAFANRCVLRRGRVISPVVTIDEAPMIGGLDLLTSIRPEEVYMVEVYDSGRHIRVYTQWFMDRVLAGRFRLSPVLFF